MTTSVLVFVPPFLRMDGNLPLQMEVFCDHTDHVSVFMCSSSEALAVPPRVLGSNLKGNSIVHSIAIARILVGTLSDHRVPSVLCFWRKREKI